MSLVCCTVFAQSSVQTNVWVPYVSNNIQYFPYVYNVTTTYQTMIPINVPTVQYYQVPFAYYGPVYQPVVQVVRPCLFCPGRFYYINSPVKY